ncbi:hypothetical protein Baya_12261 [Bagarius yarrelli]|uniref:Uncharacterized protein n=1 Tax=Bagarius yarrelli TaxID=175774 RepID=A0A556V4P8_BAGYA|nr:hypothetical protein Baya_12261 [Bagarius yarrelli]
MQVIWCTGQLGTAHRVATSWRGPSSRRSLASKVLLIQECLIVSTGNRLGVNELIEAPGAVPEMQASPASLAQPEHTGNPTKTALMSLSGFNKP